jgi:hypothetical protein
MRRAALALGVSAVLLGAATAAVAEQNACVQAYGDKLAVAQVEVSIGDGLIPVSSDVQAAAYVAKQMPADQKARFESFVAGRKMSDDLAAERLAEFFAIDNITDRLKGDGTASRRVRLSITIDKAKFPVVKVPLAPVMPTLNPSMSGAFKIQDATSGAILCEGRIVDSVSFVPDMREAKKRNGLKVLNFGRDDHLQVLAGAGNGLARDAQALFQDPSLGRMSAHRIEGVEVQQATFEIRVSQPTATSQES